MSHEHETKLAILIMLKVKEITDALENIPGLGSHISHSFKGEFVPMQSKRSTQNLLSPTY